MKKKVISMFLVASMTAGMLAGCGSGSDAGTNDVADAGTNDVADAGTTEEGKVINIYSWNKEFRERVEAVYPEVKETSKDGTVTTLNDGKIGRAHV